MVPPALPAFNITLQDFQDHKMQHAIATKGKVEAAERAAAFAKRRGYNMTCVSQKTHGEADQVGDGTLQVSASESARCAECGALTDGPCEPTRFS